MWSRSGSMRFPGLSRRARGAGLRFSRALAVLLVCCTYTLPSAAQQIGPVTQLPLPRYVSLKADKVNLREGPSKDHRTTWIFERAGLPVEITAEFDTWRKVRDSEGSEGWVQHSLLSGRRTVLVAPWKKGQNLALYARNSDSSATVALLQSGVIGNVKTCDGSWCHIFGEGFDGYMPQTNLWGVYPNETLP